MTIVDYLNAGSIKTTVLTTCHHGTHRSVAAAEIIGHELWSRGVDVVITHPHRRRHSEDAR